MLDKVPNEIKQDIVTCLKTYQGKIIKYNLKNEFNAFEIEVMQHKLTILANENECRILLDGNLKSKADILDRKAVIVLLSNARKMFDEVIKIALNK